MPFGQLHLLFLCAPRGGDGDASAFSSRGRNPFDARHFDWSAWYGALSENAPLRQLGARLGVELAHAARARATGGAGGNPALSARLEKHRRMAAAAATKELLEGGDLAETCARWRAVAGGALLPGTLQQLQATTAATAAMAANLATAAGWRGVASLLDALSRELDAGARRELAALVAVGRDAPRRGEMAWTMTVARARALFKAGIKTPGAVLEAGEEDVRDAVAKADRTRAEFAAGTTRDEKARREEDERSALDDKKIKKRNVAATTAAASVAAARAARELVEACRQFEMRRLAAEVDASGELEGMPFPVPDEEDDARYA